MSMAKASEEKSDDLEIVSIGKLYTGPWEKKYWSSSRGKDRYPYPVGFKALRTQNGITYRMEIFEGLKGPLFMISSTDGLSCSGQTPDIACESFQKKGCSRPKLWRGKRFSCKIDGMEFFGFKNAFVQRLLRELLANAGGGVEQNLLPSCIYDKDSKTRDAIPQTDLRTYPDLLPYLEKRGVTRKRSRKDKIITVTKKNVAGLEKFHIQGQGDNADVSNLRQSCQGNSDTCSAAICNTYKKDFDNKAETWQRSEVLVPMVKDENLLVSAEKDLHMNSPDVSEPQKVDIIYSKDEKLISCRNNMVMEEDGNLPNDKSTFNCSVIEDENGARLKQNNMEPINDSQLCAPNTLDHPQDMSTTQVLMTESYPEDEMGAGSSNPSSEKADFDSFGPEIANSMMTVLLPRALPLLKTFSRRKRHKLISTEKSTLVSTGENGKTQAVLSPGAKETVDLNQNKKEANSSDTTYPCVDHLESIVPDSFDNNESETQFSKKLSLLPHIMVEDKTPVDLKKCLRKSISEEDAHSPGCHLEAIDNKTELVLDLERNGADNLASKSSRYFTSPNERDMLVGQSSFFVQPHSLEDSDKTLPDHFEGVPDLANSCQEKSVTHVKKALAQDKDLSELYSSMTDLQNQTVNLSSDDAQTATKMEIEGSSKLNDNINLKHNNEKEDVLKVVACYIHPTPILLVRLSTVGNDIYLCLLCGSLSQENKVLFIYSAPISGNTAGCPSLVGHSSVILPFMKDAYGRNIALENSSVQFTPNAQSLVLVHSIKVPCCREGNIQCPCPSCSSDGFGDNGLKVVEVKAGYVSVLRKLRTAQAVCCLLVCEPNLLLAADESGKLYLWVMNSRWSGYMEQCYLPMPGCMFSSLIELKRIPKSAILVVGHNGFGEFGLWDIDKRILMSKFSDPSTTICGFIPVSLFQWQIKDTYCSYSNPGDLINEVLDATKMSFSVSTENMPIDGGDVAIWLLVSTISGPDLQNCYRSGDMQIGTVGCWKLALLVKDFVIMGSALDLRATAIGASSGHGIIGRSDGLVYIWELSTGIKVRSLLHFEGTAVSCIATDNSNSGALAIASEEGQLLLCKHSLESSTQC